MLPPTSHSRVRPASAQRRRALHGARLALLAALALLTACGGGQGPTPLGGPPRTTGTGQVEAVGPTHGQGVPFALHGIWNAAVGHARLDPRSPALVARLAAEAEREQRERSGPSFTTSTYGVAIVEAAADAPTVRVTLADHAPDDALQRAWERVPLPHDAQPPTGSDGHLVVWQPATDRLWEFWRLRRDAAAGGWAASWGGAMAHVSRNPGYYTSAAWPGAHSWWGATASSLALLGGVIRTSEASDGTIDHAIAIAVPGPRAGAWAEPAQRSDGTSDAADALPEGAHLRLDPRLDLAALHLPPLTRAIATAAQRYGLVVRDRATVVTFYGEPATAPQAVEDFPWRHLQVLRLRLRTSPGG